MQRAEFHCEACGDDEETLHVHHGYYGRGCEPWDYPIDSLWCLCESCHMDIQRELCEIHEMIALMMPPMIYDLQSALSQFAQAWPYHYIVRDRDRWKREHTESSADAQ
jgi:hypothetical protein